MSGGTHWALMEFVAGDDPKQFLEDAVALTQLTSQFRENGNI